MAHSSAHVHVHVMYLYVLSVTLTYMYYSLYNVQSCTCVRVVLFYF